MGGSDKSKMVMLMESNYGIWKTKMLDYLYVKQLARSIEELGIRPTNDNVQEWSELDRRCLGYIRDYVGVGVIHDVENSTTIYGCWKMYERKTAGHKGSLVRQHGSYLWMGEFGEARMGNNGISKIIAMGNVYVKTDLGNVLILKDMRHKPDFRMSHVSSRRLDDDGY
ncbi:hypothetical protein LIER_25098 [Lithospermum erythrorhizon]|uniref:Uncharacterized protein n=1 Tax=Lithospermum erythrorhizon TaxID=34254 RepID=A0AAV3R3D2_LITER